MTTKKSWPFRRPRDRSAHPCALAEFALCLCAVPASRQSPGQTSCLPVRRGAAHPAQQSGDPDRESRQYLLDARFRGHDGGWVWIPAAARPRMISSEMGMTTRDDLALLSPPRKRGSRGFRPLPRFRMRGNDVVGRKRREGISSKVPVIFRKRDAASEEDVMFSEPRP